MCVRKLRSLLPVFAVALAGTLAASARAADADGPSSPAFPHGLWTLELTGSYADPIRFSEDRFASGTVGVNYYLFDNLSAGLHLSGYAVDQPGERNDGYGLGLEVWGRWHLLTLDRFTLYVDGGGGRAYFDPRTPEFGTHWNYSAKVGPGISFKLDDNVYLLGGARYFHVSNGNQFGRINNPSYDGIQYYFGVMVAF